MALLGPTHRAGPRAVIFDLDETLLDRRRAWQYAVEQSIAVACGRRIDVSGLVEEYRARPWRHALSIVVESPEERLRCEALCAQLFERSALKRLLVHEGIGMALDALRGESVEMGAISREPHALALKQVQSTGLDRFLAVLAPSADGDWDVANGMRRCLTFLDRGAEECAFVSGHGEDLATAAALGCRCFEAGWVNGARTNFDSIAAPADLGATLWGAWRRGG